MIPLLTTVFLASFAGSLHCLGMCGGLVAFAAGSDESARRSWPGHGAYALGRLVSYGTLGIIAGSLGAALDLSSDRLSGVQGMAGFVAGALIVGWGVASFFPQWSARWWHSLMPEGWHPPIARVLGGVRAWPPVARASAVGLLTGLLPCGWLYAFVLSAAGTGHPLAGAAVMTAFWAGTVPILAGLGVGVQRLAGPLRARLPRIAATAMIILGLWTVAHRVEWVGVSLTADSLTEDSSVLAAPVDPEAPVDLEALEDRTRELDSTDLPCCHGED